MPQPGPHRMKALLVHLDTKTPIGIVDIGEQTSAYFRQREIIEIHTAPRPRPGFQIRPNLDPSPVFSETHLIQASYLRNLGKDELLVLCCLDSKTERLLADYFFAFASGDHDAILSHKVNSCVVSILGYLRR